MLADDFIPKTSNLQNPSNEYRERNNTKNFIWISGTKYQKYNSINEKYEKTESAKMKKDDFVELLCDLVVVDKEAEEVDNTAWTIENYSEIGCRWPHTKDLHSPNPTCLFFDEIFHICVSAKILVLW